MTLDLWLPALDGVVAKLERGAKIADVGCGIGASTIFMAQTYPKSRLFGYDADSGLIELARQRAAEAGLSNRVTFDVASSTDFPGREYDLVCHFDCLHDMDSCIRAARRVREVLAPGGTWMIVDPLANESREARLRRIVDEQGLSRFRRVTQSPFNLVLEAQV